MTARGGSLSLPVALREARRLGCTVSYPRRTGEVLVISPDRGTRVRVNRRRKDASKKLLALILKLIRDTEPGSP
jgi:hypothetical protein